MEEPETLLEYQGLNMSFHPSQSRKECRFVDVDSIEIPDESVPYLANVGAYMTFCDPAELHYRTFENIIPLDRAFSQFRLKFKMTKGKSLAQGVWSSSLSGGSTNLLLELDTLPFYVEPLNKRQRGGKRFVFQSSALADALTEAVRKAKIPNISSALVAVNSVYYL